MTEAIPVSRTDRKAEVKARVLDVAARRIRQDGAPGVSVSKVMKEVGLTHGTFYAHFESKEDLVAQAVQHAADVYREKLRKAGENGGIGALAKTYLTVDHANDPGNGCFIATLGPEMSRVAGPVADTFADRIEAGISMIEEVIGPQGLNEDAARKKAITSLATVVGGMILARAGTDERQRDEVLAACLGAFSQEGKAS